MPPHIPSRGGAYVYLTRAFGSWLGFLFGWTQLAAIITGSIGAMAFVFADYAVALFSLPTDLSVRLAVGAVVAVTAANLFGIAIGKTVQNVLTLAKIFGLVAVVVVGIGWGSVDHLAVTDEAATPAGIGMAMILVLYAYGGWSDAAYVAAEIREPRRNIPLALLLGTATVTLIYLLVNLAYVLALGLEGIRSAQAPAAEVLRSAVGDWAAGAISGLVIVSVLAAVNGMIFTGSRVYAAMGADHRLFSILGRWNERLGAPVWSLLAQAAVTIGLVLVVGTQAGREAIDTVFLWCGLSTPPWKQYEGGFGTLVAVTAPAFWLFFLLTGLSLFVLRQRDPEAERPFSVPLYPVVPILFCLMSGYMLYASVAYVGGLALLGMTPLIAGLPLYVLNRSLLKPQSY